MSKIQTHTNFFLKSQTIQDRKLNEITTALRIRRQVTFITPTSTIAKQRISSNITRSRSRIELSQMAYEIDNLHGYDWFHQIVPIGDI